MNGAIPNRIWSDGMKLLNCAASLLVLSLFAGPVFAQDSTAPDPAADAAAQPLPEAVLALLNDKRTAQELADDDLKARVKASRSALKTEGLTDDVKSQLQALADADGAELATRKAAKAEEPAAPVVEEAAPAVEKTVEQPVEQAAPEATPTPVAEIPQEVTDLLNDGRDVADLTDDELKARSKTARKFSKDENLPANVREQLTDISKAARAALVAREQPAEKTAEEPAIVPAPETAPAAEQAQQPAPEIIVEPTPDVKVVEPVTPTAPPPVDKIEAQELDGNAGEPEAEKKAKAFLADETPADSLSDEALRSRLDGMRDLMAENELSSKTERALRKKLQAEREVLRDRVAKVKAEEEAKAMAAAAAEAAKTQATDAPVTDKKKKPKFGINIIITPDTPRREVLRDRRLSEDLEDVELRRRIREFRDVEREDAYLDYDSGLREYWRSTVNRDRELLRRRMIEERLARRAELDSRERRKKYDLVIEDDEEGDEDFPADIFAAEVDDADIEKALIAPPRKKFKQRYTIEDIAERPQLREAMTRIEIDTIRFGFNEAFVREEEVDNLDEIASVIERVLKKYPREIFLIEGHTDAVGSDAYNLKLSRARAEAVKKALTSFYVISPRNLQTIGLGERYLKIPTADQEPENRRVSLSRATALVGELEE